MKIFKSRTTAFNGNIILRRRRKDVFPLFSPEGEKMWVPGWAPEYLSPSDGNWRRGQIFRTREERGDAVWIVVELDVARCRVVYCRVESGRYVARIEVECRTVARGTTRVLVSYTYAGLTIRGNQDIARMSNEEFGWKMKRWKEWIEEHFSRDD